MPTGLRKSIEDYIKMHKEIVYAKEEQIQLYKDLVNKAQTI